MKAWHASDIRRGIELARGDQRIALKIILFQRVPHLTYEAYKRTFRRDHAAKVNRVTNDPQRIEKRKSIAPAFTVPRRREQADK